MEATETFAAGGEQVTVAVQIDTSSATPISGNVAGTFGDAHIVGDVNLTGDLIIEGLLTGIDTFTLEGNGFQLLFQDGGRPDLAGVDKTAWIRWGDTPIGWQTGDRVAVAPTVVGVYVPTETTWGSARPANSPNVTLVNGDVARPEVVNLTQTIVLKNLRRIHFHDAAGVASLECLRILNCGTAGVLADYPLHFHLNGDASRGSIIRDVVVEGGKNHAFVPHGSHGISFPGCAAYNTKGVAFWWDRPLESSGGHANDSFDIDWDDCLSMLSSSSPAEGESTRLAGFWLGAGKNLTCRGAVATCVPGNPSGGSRQRSGFHWPEQASDEAWDSTGIVAHNNAENGIFTWQNTIAIVNPVDDAVCYRNGYTGINHGAYRNRYQYHRAVLTGHQLAVIMHAKTPEDGGETLLFEDVLSDGPLSVPFHNSDSMQRSIHRRCTYTQVVYTEGSKPSYIIFEDCGLVPADFDLADINASSIIELVEGGVLVDRWAGSWQ